MSSKPPDGLGVGQGVKMCLQGHQPPGGLGVGQGVKMCLQGPQVG